MSNEICEEDFIREEIQKDVEKGQYSSRVHTRFPPEPNGFLHIGHAKAICLNFDIAREFSGTCNLRMDDTNPEKEEEKFEHSIQEDIRWLGYEWDGLFHASDYFEKLYYYAQQLIHQGDAYVDSLSDEEIREYRGTPTTLGKDSPYRNRLPEENLQLFEDMRKGKFPAGSCVLRAKIDMTALNIVMRDPLMYRIRYQPHPRLGNKWCIYPLYDFAHCLSDAQEKITHSLCSLEFEVRRPLYDWFLKKCGILQPPRQIEFSRLRLSHTLLSKRKLGLLVKEGYVSGWDDPRMPTLAGLRRRGYPPEAIRNFCRDVGVTKANSTIDIKRLEHAVREELNTHAQRWMAVLDPIELIITNYSEETQEEFSVSNNPEPPESSRHKMCFSSRLYIERDDFLSDPPRKFFRLAPGKMVRLKHSYCVTGDDYETDGEGRITRVFCHYHPETRGGDSGTQKVRGTLHWVDQNSSIPVEVREYGRLLIGEEEGEDFLSQVNPDSLKVSTAQLEKEGRSIAPGSTVQFLRLGYFSLDATIKDRMVFHRTVSLKDSWQRIVRNKRENE